MPAATKHLLIEQGATFRLSLVWRDKITGTPIDLTGYSARMHVRSAVAATTTIIELTTANSRIALGGTAGTIQITVSDEDTAALAAADGVYDLELASPAGDVTRLIEGKVKIKAEVTR